MGKDDHKDHRDRTRKHFINANFSLNTFAPHEMVEFLLYYALSRGDTNEIAHHLLDKFGSLSGIFDASYQDLCKVKGIGENSAVLIKLIPCLVKEYLSDRNDVGNQMRSSSDCGKYLLPKFIGETSEVVYLLCMDNKQKVLGCPTVCRGEVSSAQFSIRRVVEEALKLSATTVVLAHNHPRGLALPSPDDVATTKQLYPILKQMGIILLDHIVVAGDDFVSMADSGVFAQFTSKVPRY